MRKDITDIPSIKGDILSLSNLSDDLIVKNATKFISNFFQTENNIPEEYTATFIDVSDFEKKISEAATSQSINEIYWNDFINQLQAYSVMTFFRASELLRSSINLLNNHEIVSSATIARSLLELSTALLDNANRYFSIIKNVNPTKGAVNIVEGLETMIVKNIWGTRHSIEKNDPLEQQNILTILQRVAKNPAAKNLLEKYSFLCDLAHPNRIGNKRFWGDNWETESDGTIKIKISRCAENFLNNETIENILWAMSWGSECTKNGYLIIQETIVMIYLKLLKI